MKVVNKKYAVFLDANAMRGKWWVTKDLVGSVEKADGTLLNCTFYVAEIVEEEWLKNFADHAQKQQDKVSSARNVLKEMGFNVLDDDHTTLAKEVGRNYLRKIGVKKVKTPYENIDLKKLIKLAVDHKPPFKNKDEGIKDAVFAETMRNYALEHPDEHILAVTEDVTLASYLKDKQSSGLPRSDVIGDLKELENYINLKAINVKSVVSEYADDLFYTSGLSTTVFNKSGLSKYFANDYEKRFGSNTMDHVTKLDWLDSEDGERFGDDFGDQDGWLKGPKAIRIEPPKFLKKQDGLLLWQSKVVYEQEYWLNSMTADGIAINYPNSLVHRVSYSVKWSSRQDKNSLNNGELIEVNFYGEHKHMKHFASRRDEPIRTKIIKTSNLSLFNARFAHLVGAPSTAMAEAMSRLANMPKINLPSQGLIDTMAKLSAMQNINIPKLNLTNLMPFQDLINGTEDEDEADDSGKNGAENEDDEKNSK